MLDGIDFFVQKDEVIDVRFLHVVMLPKLKVSHIHLYFLLLLFVINLLHLVDKSFRIEERY